jgi:hypothetical protein
MEINLDAAKTRDAAGDGDLPLRVKFNQSQRLQICLMDPTLVSLNEETH